MYIHCTCTLLLVLHHTCTGWINALDELGQPRLVFCRLVLSTCNWSEAEQISFTLRIQDDFSWSVLFYQQQIEAMFCQVLGTFPGTTHTITPPAAFPYHTLEVCASTYIWTWVT